MKLPPTRFIERAAETLGDDLAQLHQVGTKVAERLVIDTGKLTKKARYRLRNGATCVADIEEKVAADIQTRPLAYLLVTLGLACVVFLKIAFDRQRKERDKS